jgi:WD40 repeat protein/GTPase SAR1 family protein/RNase P subunit RPR2
MANPTNFSFDVFLSHNSRDKARVRRLAERLRGAGVRVWFDEWIIRPGDDIYLNVERGLEAARTLVLCLSPAALGSDWVGLERSTVLFRDPSNAARRFIPLLLADCDLPDAIRRYKYVDFREEAEPAFEELLTACRPAEEQGPPTPRPEPEERAKVRKKPKLDDSPVVLERRLAGHRGFVNSVAVSKDGKWVVSGSDDGTVRIWDIETGISQATPGGHGAQVKCIAITPDGKKLLSCSHDRTIKTWAFPSGRLERVLKVHEDLVRPVVLVADGEMLLSGDQGDAGSIKLWVTDSAECTKTIQAGESVTAAALSGDRKRLLIGGHKGKVVLWDLGAGQNLATMKQHADRVWSVALTRDGRHGFSGSEDKTVKIWDLETGTCLGTLEGHLGPVRSVALSPDGAWIASAGYGDQTVCLWDWRSGACLQNIRQDGSPTSVTFSPDGSRIVVGTRKGSIFLHRLSRVRAAPSAEPVRRYVNAKVVLVGESGVGKSGLAHRLIEDRFVPTHSTHGMQVWRLDLPEGPQPDDVYLEREALLWDLAGQEDYRLIHQLFLDETAMALVLINPQKDDPFAEVGDWLKALRSALGAKDPRRDAARILIAARADVGGIRVGRQKIDRFLQEHGFAGYLATSAMTGENCSDGMNGGVPSALKRLIADLIPWDRQPWTSTPRLLAAIKNAVLEMRDKKEIRLLRFAELCQRLEQTLTGQRFVEADVHTAVTLLANHGLVMPFQFGDLVLMRPELLNGYAGAVIRAARKHVDEIGCVREQDVFECKLDFEGVDRLEPADEELLMRAMVQTFLDKSLCIAEDTPQGRHLVFPSQYRRERPFPTDPEVFVSYTFTGEPQTVYTTLVVRLWYSREFDHKELWRNAAEFLTSKGRMVGLVMEKTGDGQGTINVFFESGVPDELKVAFIEYVHQHLGKWASDVTRDRRYICGKCDTPVRDRELVRKRLAERKEFVYCPGCGKKVPFQDHIEQRLGSDPVARRVLAMEQTDQRERDTQALEQILIGHMMAICGEANQIFRPVTMFDYGIDGEVEFKGDDGQASGRKIYVQLKSGGSYLRTRKSDGKEVFDVKNPRHLGFWVNQPVDVYLVIRDAEETIRWMNVTKHLKARGEKQGRQIVFEGEKLDAPAVWRMRDRLIKR